MRTAPTARCFGNWLSLALLCLLSAAAAQAKPPIQAPPQDSSYDILIARVKFASDTKGSNPWSLYPGSEKNLLEEFANTAHCRVKLDPRISSRNPWTGDEDMFNGVVDLTNLEQMRKYPILLMTSDGVFRLSSTQKATLKQYLEDGGFIIMDDCVADEGAQDYFFKCSCMVMEDIFGAGSVVPIPHEHEIFCNVFDLRTIGLPFLQGTYHEAQGVFISTRLAVFISSTDLHCGWVDRNGQRFAPGKPGRGPHAYREAIQMGTNILMYVLSH